MGSLFLVGPSSTEPEQDSCSFQLCCSLIIQLYLHPLEQTQLYATTQKVNEQDTKTFPKCYVGRNGKQKSAKTTVTRSKNIENVML